MDGASQTPHLSKTRRSGCIVALNECPISLKFQALLIQSGCNKSLKNLSQWPNGLSPPHLSPPCLRDHKDHSVLLTEVQTNREVGWCFWWHGDLLLDLEGCRGLTTVLQDVHDVQFCGGLSNLRNK